MVCGREGEGLCSAADHETTSRRGRACLVVVSGLFALVFSSSVALPYVPLPSAFQIASYSPWLTTSCIDCCLGYRWRPKSLEHWLGKKAIICTRASDLCLLKLHCLSSLNYTHWTYLYVQQTPMEGTNPLAWCVGVCEPLAASELSR